MKHRRNLSVVLVVLDCARADHLSCYNYARSTTPRIDSLARNGIRFPNMVTPAPWTLPAHASLFTGLYPSSHGATDEHRKLESSIPTLAEMVAAVGYATAGFCANPWIIETGLARGFTHFFDHRPKIKRLSRQYFLAQKVTDSLLRRRDSGGRRTNRAFSRWLRSVGRETPFFTFVHYNEPHLKYHPPPPYDTMFLNGTRHSRIKAVNQDCNKYIAGYAPMDAEDFHILTALYDGELRYADKLVADLCAILSSENRLEDTLIIITADHGENLGDHGLMSHKFVLFDTLLKIPLILRCPAVLPAGVVCDSLVQSVDILPTIARLLELDIPAVEGVALAKRGSLLPVDRSFTVSEKFRPNLRVFRERYPLFDSTAHDLRRRALRTRSHKYIWQSDGSEVLYDLEADPQETVNVAAENTSLTADLRRELETWVSARKGPSSLSLEEPEFDPEVKRQLAELGYIEN